MIAEVNVWPIVFGVAIVCAVIGAMIGSPKGHAAAGFVLGLFLGFIGWVVVALMSPAAGHDAAGMPPPAPSTPPGWWPDPYQRHQLRYFDGVRWSDHVSDGGVQSSDPA